MLSSGLQYKVFLASGIDADHTETDTLGGYLGREMTESLIGELTKRPAKYLIRGQAGELTTTGAEENNPIAALRIGFSQGTIARDTSTKSVFSYQPAVCVPP